MFADEGLRGSRLWDVKLGVGLSNLQVPKRLITLSAYARSNINVGIVGATWKVRG